MHKLSYILNNIMNFKWSDALFLPEDEVWNKDTKGMVTVQNPLCEYNVRVAV